MNIQRTILTNLKQRHPGLMPTGTLWAEVGLDEAGCTYTDFKTSLNELEVKGQIVVITGEDRTKAKITDAGMARLAE
jgi:hypothetical protein